MDDFSINPLAFLPGVPLDPTIGDYGTAVAIQQNLSAPGGAPWEEEDMSTWHALHMELYGTPW